MKNIVTKNPKHTVVYSALGVCVTLGTTLALAESLPTWARTAGGVVGLLAAGLGVAVSWPTVRDMINGKGDA